MLKLFQSLIYLYRFISKHQFYIYQLTNHNSWRLIMGFKQVNFRIDEEIARQLKLIAFEKEMTQTDLVTYYIKEGLKRESTQTKLD